MNLEDMDLPALKRIYASASFQFQRALLNGTEWREMQDDREFLVELAVAIQRKEPTYFVTHPAAGSRDSNRSSGPTG